MAEDRIIHTMREPWHETSGDHDLALLGGELISEEKKPSLYSLSLTDSVCSSSTIDLDTLEQNKMFYSINVPDLKCESTPMENNFMNEKRKKSDLGNGQHNKNSAIELSNMNNALNYTVRKSNSLHDVSSIFPLELTAKSSNTFSCETIHSQSLSSTTKSKDSGFQRSVSCLSLTSGKRNYDHVQSKVKAYIRNIKESEALRKKNKILSQSLQQCEISEQKIIADEIGNIMEKEDLIQKIRELKQELHEKALFIDAQQRNYNNLLLKLAEAKNTIDTLRLQSLSLKYTTLNESKNLSRFNHIDFDIFEKVKNEKSQKLNKSNTNLTDDSKESDSFKEPVSFSLETSNCSLGNVFLPETHSTPVKNENCPMLSKNECSKSLSPVSKMFCSSSRLDKKCKPLANLKNQENDTSFSLTQSISKKVSYSSSQKSANKQKNNISKSKHEAIKAATTVSGAQNCQPSHIDLPNDDPFDKVKKWQASLPSIKLLNKHSSSDCDDHSSSRNTVRKDKKETIRPVSPKFVDKESEICSLSQELVRKCRISTNENSSVQVGHCNINQNSAVQSEELCSGFKSEVDSNKQQKLLSKNENKSFEQSNYDFETEEDPKVCKASNFVAKANSENKSFLQRKCETSKAFFKSQRSKFPVPINIHDSSISENESHSYNPKSSLTHTNDHSKDNTNNNDDDSSSISSSVFGSNTSLSISNVKKPKRKSIISEPEVLNKVPKLVSNKNFVLREPKLNVTTPIGSTCQVQKREVCQNTTGNYETWFKYRNSNNNNSVNAYLKTESSQRKAWNARNNANFYVCKEFYFKKSSSLQECISLMEGMVEKGSLIIESALDRSTH